MSRIKSYLDRVVSDAIQSSSWSDLEIKYDYRIIGNYLLFAMDGGNTITDNKIPYRLVNNLPKNFGLNLELVLGGNPLKWPTIMFDIERLGQEYGGIQVGNTIDIWYLFGHMYIVNYIPTLIPCIDHIVDKMGNDDFSTIEGFYKYVAIYKDLYGITPLESVLMRLGQKEPSRQKMEDCTDGKQ